MNMHLQRSSRASPFMAAIGGDKKKKAPARVSTREGFPRPPSC
jgi:hypothetical protein